MADDYSINAKITADTSGFEKGIDKAHKASKNLSKSVSGVIQGLGKNGLVGALGAVGLASSGLTATLGSVVKIAKQVSKTIGECTEAYKAQLIAERALNTAIQNNPFVTGASSKALKEFASEMQKVSNYGDEELIPMMSNLISLGRTEAETMQIISVAMDMSAGMGISLDTAITQLNATLNGNIGRLGQQNAELKDLTEEELKQGKAIEILGEKFKGLSGATADTSKQLQNIKGDFKEALGQFTLPSSDMWNKFWAGFYERGIEVINKINSYLDAQTIGKKLAGAITDQLKAFGAGDVGGRVDYIRNTLKVVTDEELLALQNYLEGLAYISSDQEQILRRIKAETDARKQNVINQKAQAEASARQKREEEEMLDKQKELAEIKEKQLKIQKEWEDKLFSIRIENLERQRDLELENEELTEEQKIAISEFYGEQILAMKIKQIEKERDEALNGENVTEEAREKIRLYYENKITQAKQDEAKKRVKATKQETKEEEKQFKELSAVAKKVAETITDAFKNTYSKIKSVFGKVGSVFTSIFDFNADDALTNLLVFEDKILTFFVETLPKLPNFFASAIQSISVLIKTLGKVIDFNVISDILRTLVQGIADWVSGGGWKDLLDLVLALQMAIEKAVEENIDLIVETLEKMLPDLVTTLTKSIVSASRTLGKIAKVLLPLVAKIIKAIINVITSNEVVEASIEAVEGLVEGLIPAIVDILVSALPKIINFFLIKLPLYTPQLLTGILNGIINALEKMDFGEVVSTFFEGFTDGISNFSTNGLSNSLKNLFKKTMSFSFWLDVLQNFISAFAGLLMGVVQSVFEDIPSLFSGGSSGSGFDPVDIIDPLGIRHAFGFANGSNSVPRGLAMVGEAGPELVRFRGGEQVLNNRNTNKALAEMGKGGNSFNVVFNNTKDTTAFTMMRELRTYNRQMAINGII